RASGRPSSGRRTPSKTISPLLIGSSRLIARHNVDLPEPDGPITTTTSPRAIDRFTSLSTWSSPNHLLTPLSTIKGSSVIIRPIAVHSGSVGGLDVSGGDAHE